MALGGSVSRVTEVSQEIPRNSKYWPKAGGSLFRPKSLEVLRCSVEAIMFWLEHVGGSWSLREQQIQDNKCNKSKQKKHDKLSSQQTKRRSKIFI
jgi:hypothetical protein